MVAFIKNNVSTKLCPWSLDMKRCNSVMKNIIRKCKMISDDGQAAVRGGEPGFVGLIFFFADYLSMECIYYATGGCNVATLGQIEVFKMASKMATTKWHFSII